MKLVLILLVIVGSGKLINAQHLRINETMTLNSFWVSDNGIAYPWIEFVNHSTKSINLSTYYISSDSSNLRTWQLPARTLEPDSLFLFWLSGKGGSNHSNFEIDVNAEYLLLTDGDRILDNIALTSMVMNESYGLRNGFTGERVYFMNHEITPGKENADPGPWVKVQGNAAFQKGDAGYFGCVVYKDKMWFLDYETLTDDGSSWINLVEVWNSPDGYNWNLVNATPPYKHGSMITVFKGYMWAFDGRAFRSSDGIHWEQVSSNTPSSERIVAFNNCLWILQNQSIFRSYDGISWEKVVENVPWSERTWPAFMEHDGKLWMFGGNSYYKSYFDEYYTDVWSSEDGIHWELKNSKAPWRGTFWFTYASYDGKIWMIDGGWNFWDRLNPYNGNGNEVWHTKDGITWHKSSAPVNWFNRHAQFTWIFKDELWIGAGYAGGGPHHLYNDIWKYSRKAKPIFSNPEISATYGVKTPLGVSSISETSFEYSIGDSIATIKNDTLIPTKVGETTIVVSHDGDDFYRPEEKKIKLTVMKKDLIVKPIDTEVAFGQAVPTLSLQYSGFVFGEGMDVLDQPPSITHIPADFSPVGTYYLSPEGGFDDNYNYVFEEGELVILPSAENVLVFPNPAQRILEIISSTTVEGDMVIEFYNSTGSLIHKHIQRNFESEQFDISTLHPGIYIIKITSATETVVRKIVKI